MGGLSTVPADWTLEITPALQALVMEAMIAYLHNDSSHVMWAQAANTGETNHAHLS